jgi:BirA family transcriptional regulator, biotin operon repressor / biotin---[acetyl-CoA-carboxylase] ligase
LSARPQWPEGTARIILDAVDSTNSEALRLADAAPLWLLAGEQTAGRGRRGRPWASPRGNFHATYVTSPAATPAATALRSFAAALALREALAAVTGLPGAITLKWPNDVLLNGGKVAGILLENTATPQGRPMLCIGIGVNLIAAPDPALIEAGATLPVTVLQETGHRVTPEAFLDVLAPAFARYEARLVAEGFAPLREEWLAHAARLGEEIRARTGTETRTGTFETIDATGALVLRQPQGRVSITAAEVFF